MAKKSLVIVESPAKAKTINKYLGSNYLVKASMGHIRDLPPRRFGVDIEHDFEPEYQPVGRKKDVIKELKDAAAKSDQIYLACDLDREGEAIAWHIAELLKLEPERTKRVIFNEITQRAIKEAFKKPDTISMDRVNAQQARRILDRIVGYQLSPLLWKKVVRGLSAGRVQSVAVKFIVEREKEIQAFQTTEYWKMLAQLQQGGELSKEDQEASRFEAQLVHLEGRSLNNPERHRIGTEEEAQALHKAIQQAPFTVVDVDKRDKKDSPKAPLITSTLQQQASIRLKFSTTRTMRVAQQLYEGIDLGKETVGLITYMRTDSKVISKDAQAECLQYIEDEHGKEYLPKKPRVYKSGKRAQEAHEAIRPTSVLRTPAQLKSSLSRDQYRLYELIWKYFVASQMASAIFSHTRLDIEAGPGLFRAKGKIMKFDGHTRVFGDARKDDTPLLPDLSVGELLKLLELSVSQHFTQPPPRYSEATLVKALEKEGIGRPSTYAAIIKTIQDRKYVKQEKRVFHATPLGMLVTDKLVKHFPDIMDTAFTSNMEDELDKIEEAHLPWREVVGEFYEVFAKDLSQAKEEMRGVNEDPEPSEYLCEKCGEKMVYLWNKWGRFLGCSGYPECQSSCSIDEEGKPRRDEETDHTCTECGSAMVVKKGKNGRFLACTGYPECKRTLSLDEEGNPILEEKKGECEQCGEDMIVRTGRRGTFLGCNGYPKCRNTRPWPPTPEGDKKTPNGTTDEVCPDCDKPMAVKYSRRGPFLGCTGYPECKKTKSMPKSMRSQPKDAGIECDECGKKMVIRSGRRGQFVACTGYPKCRNTKSMQDLEALKAQPSS